MKRIKLFNESSNYKDIIEDYLLELIDLGWEIEKIDEVIIDDDWWIHVFQIDSNGFRIRLNPPFGIDLTNNYRENFDTIDHFNTWSEWFKVISSVLRKLESHVGEVKVESNFGERVSWGGGRWMTILVKKQKIN